MSQHLSRTIFSAKINCNFSWVSSNTRKYQFWWMKEIKKELSLTLIEQNRRFLVVLLLIWLLFSRICGVWLRVFVCLFRGYVWLCLCVNIEQIFRLSQWRSTKKMKKSINMQQHKLNRNHLTNNRKISYMYPEKS